MADKNIDFRRVLNLKTYFDYNAISLTTDVLRIEEVARWKCFLKDILVLFLTKEITNE